MVFWKPIFSNTTSLIAIMGNDRRLDSKNNLESLDNDVTVLECSRRTSNFQCSVFVNYGIISVKT